MGEGGLGDRFVPPPGAMGVAMYTMRLQKADGTVEITAVDGKRRVKLDVDPGVQMLHADKREIEYNMSRLDNNGKFLSAAARTRQIKDHIASERQANANRRKGSLKKTHVVPPELYWKTHVEQGRDAARDHDHMKKVAAKHGFKL